jgi:hypothetical protein
MTRDFRLARSQHFDEITDAYFARVHQVKESEARAVSQRAEELLHIREFFRLIHDEIYFITDQHIRLDIFVWAAYAQFIFA